MPMDEYTYAELLVALAAGPGGDTASLLHIPGLLRQLAVATGGSILERPDTFR